MRWKAVVLRLGLSIGSALAPVAALSAAPSGDDAVRLHALFAEQWEYNLRAYPEFASHLGDKRYNREWTDESLAGYQARHENDERVLKQLATIDRANLSEADRLNCDLFQHRYRESVEGYRYRGRLLPVDHTGGIQSGDQLALNLVFASVTDYEDWIARLGSFGRRMDQTIALMREGMRAGIVHPAVIMNRVPRQVADQIVDDPGNSLFFKPFLAFGEGIEAPDRQRLTADARKAIAQVVVPAFKKLKAFLADEYLPACRQEVGLWQLPDGEQWYRYAIGHHTTTDLTAEEIHEIGQAEVKRIRREMEEVCKKVGFAGTFDEFLEFLRTDRQFYYDDPQELLAGYRSVCQRIDRQLPKLFNRKPKTWYVVEPIPDHLAPDVPTAYYSPAAADGSRPGTVYVNLYKPEIRSRYQMATLMLHEGVPGHHFQMTLAMEMEDLPNFRRHARWDAYGEGWALYCESLGDEMGLYRDPYWRFGQLTYDMWRAARLVVDTGIHHYRWSRGKAIDYLKDKTGKDEHAAANEIDRYIVWPGQALSYKIGQRKIRELRHLAEAELGQDFDIRAFHDVLLNSGALPLDVLEKQVAAWIKREKAQPPVEGN